VSPRAAARRRRPALIGLGLAAAYVLVCITTLRVTDHDVRPLFEGIGPDSPYRWVSPPKEFAPGNVKPKASSTDVELLPSGSQAAGLLSSDSQIVLNLDGGAVPPKAGDNRVTVSFVPLDPAKLGKLTPPLRPDGNAYRVAMTYKPSGEPVSGLTAPGNVLILVPEPADTVLFSEDGRAWQELDSQHESGSGAESATFTSPGYYLAGTRRPPPAPVAASSRGYGTVVVIVVVGVLAIVLAWTPYVRQRLGRRGATGKQSTRAAPDPRSGRRRR
jgi:hypothetical protein